jgi:hypothetical protein
MRAAVLAAVALAGSVAAARAQSPPKRPPAPALTDKEKEAFLLEAEVVRTRRAPGGVTGSLRATLRRDALTHDANVQTIDEQDTQVALQQGAELDFRDSYKNNVAAYRLDRLMGLNMVPVTVVREHRGQPASFTWWLDEMLMTELQRYRQKKRPPDVAAFNRQIYVTRVFDQLIYNFDRNAGNLLIDKRWRVFMIDHTRAFKIFDDLRDEKKLAASCERALLAGLRRLDKAALEGEMEDLLSGGQIDGLLARRDRIVAFYDRLIAERGEAAVLYDLPPRAPR